MLPYATLVDACATCGPCQRANCCLALVGCFSGCAVVYFAFLGAVWAAAAGLVVWEVPAVGPALARTFFASQALGMLSDYYLGIWSWVLASWSGCLCLPQCFVRASSPCCGGGGGGGGGEHDDEEDAAPAAFPPRCAPLLGRCPLSCVLAAYGLGGATYVEDRAAFWATFPRRRAIDDGDEDEGGDERDGDDGGNEEGSHEEGSNNEGNEAVGEGNGEDAHDEDDDRGLREEEAVVEEQRRRDAGEGADKGDVRHGRDRDGASSSSSAPSSSRVVAAAAAATTIAAAVVMNPLGPGGSE